MVIAFIILLMFILFLSSMVALGGETDTAQRTSLHIFFSSLVALVTIFVWG